MWISVKVGEGNRENTGSRPVLFYVQVDYICNCVREELEKETIFGLQK